MNRYEAVSTADYLAENKRLWPSSLGALKKPAVAV